jgi:Zn-dependent membrane protease YugP
MKQLESTQILSGDELKGGRQVLNAAALTYVAAMAVSLTHLLRLLVLRDSRD